MGEVLFEPTTHTYSVNGVVIPESVTQICERVYGGEIDDRLDDVMDAAADRGVTMHKVLELALSGEDYDGEYPSMYVEYVDAIEQWLGAHTIVPLAIEEPIYSPTLVVAGTPDLICMFDDVLTLVDYKFVSTINKPKVRAQLTGYCEILNECGVFPEQMIAVQFLAGKVRPYPVDFGGDEWEVALRARDIRNRKYARGRIG